MSFRSPRRVDHYRVLRSDGKPSFSSSKYVNEGDAERVSSKPPVTGSKTLPLIEALKIMSEKKVRSVVVKEPRDKYWGVLLVEDVLNYLGGGELYDIVLNRFDGDINKAINVSIGEIGRKGFPFVRITDKLDKVVRLFLSEQIDLVPVVDNEERPIGVISVHDVLRYLRGLKIGRKIKDATIGFIPLASYSSTLRETIKQMSNSGLRFIFVKNEADQIIGYVDYRAIINYFASGQAIKNSLKGSLEESLMISVGELVRTGMLVVSEDTTLEQALELMLDKNDGFALITKGDEPVGILTEYDVFLSLMSGE